MFQLLNLLNFQYKHVIFAVEHECQTNVLCQKGVRNYLIITPGMPIVGGYVKQAARLAQLALAMELKELLDVPQNIYIIHNGYEGTILYK